MFAYRVFSRDKAPEELYRFRYGIYVEEMGRIQRYADHEACRIRDPLDEVGHQGLMYADDRLAGCIRMNFLRDGGVGEYFDLYGLSALSDPEIERASICTRLMVAPFVRRSAASIGLVTFAYEFGLQSGIETCFIDCNSHLTRFFKRFGWKPLFNKEHAEYGRVDVMRLDLIDVDHLSRIGSPFAPIARHYLDESSRTPIKVAAE